MTPPDDLTLTDYNDDFLELAAALPNDHGNVAIFTATYGSDTTGVDIGLSRENLIRVRNWASALLYVTEPQKFCTDPQPLADYTGARDRVQNV